MLSDLHDVSDTPIRQLDGELAAKFRRLTSYVNLIYGTSYYPLLTALIKRKFGDLETVTPGTVGAYCSGCLNPVPVPEAPASCSPSCVAGLPGSSGPCPLTVVWAVATDGSYQFDLLNRGTSPNGAVVDALLFIDLTQGHGGELGPLPLGGGFTGLTQAEKDQLVAMGLQRARVIGYLPSGSYEQLTPMEPIGQLPTRPANLAPGQKLIPAEMEGKIEVDVNVSHRLVVALVVVGIILVLLFFLWTNRYSVMNTTIFT